VCLIEVTDNGVGFKDLNFTEAVTCFSSAREVDTSVDAEQNVKFGRYGCGLSASLVYSARSTGGEMRVTSKQKASPLMRIANVKFDTCSGQGTHASRVCLVL
jgi:DNA topoisomerase VI subunit B